MSYIFYHATHAGNFKSIMERGLFGRSQAYYNIYFDHLLKQDGYTYEGLKSYCGKSTRSQLERAIPAKQACSLLLELKEHYWGQRKNAVYLGSKEYAIGNSLAGFEFIIDVTGYLSVIKYNDWSRADHSWRAYRKLLGSDVVPIVVFHVRVEEDELPKELLKGITKVGKYTHIPQITINTGYVSPSRIVNYEFLKVDIKNMEVYA